MTRTDLDEAGRRRAIDSIAETAGLPAEFLRRAAMQPVPTGSPDDPPPDPEPVGDRG